MNILQLMNIPIRARISVHLPRPFPASGCTQALSCTCALLDRAHKCVCRMSWPCSTCKDLQWLPLMLLVGVVSKLHFVSNNGTLTFYKQLYQIFIFSKRIGKMILSRKNSAFIFKNGACVIKKYIIWSALDGYIQHHAGFNQFLCIMMLRNSVPSFL